MSGSGLEDVLQSIVNLVVRRGFDWGAWNGSKLGLGPSALP